MTRKPKEFKMKQYTISLPPELYRAVSGRAEKEGETFSGAMRRLAYVYAKRREKEK